MNTARLESLLGRKVVLQPLPFETRHLRQEVLREVLWSVLGVLLCTAFLIGAKPIAWFSVPITAIIFLLLWNGAQLAFCLSQRIQVSQQELKIHGVMGQKTLVWQHMTGLKLHFYPVKRKASQGSLKLIIHQSKQKVSIGSSLEGFASVLQQAALCARQKKLELSPISHENLEMLGL